jgi:hypothetical protein
MEAHGGSAGSQWHDIQRPGNRRGDRRRTCCRHPTEHHQSSPRSPSQHCWAHLGGCRNPHRLAMLHNPGPRLPRPASSLGVAPGSPGSRLRPARVSADLSWVPTTSIKLNRRRQASCPVGAPGPKHGRRGGGFGRPHPVRRPRLLNTAALRDTSAVVRSQRDRRRRHSRLDVSCSRALRPVGCTMLALAPSSSGPSRVPTATSWSAR